MNLSLVKNIKTILYLNRQQITVCSTTLSAPAILDLPTRVVADLEIIDLEAFNNLFYDWLVQNKIPTGDIVIILSPSVYYSKDGSLTDDAAQKTSQLESFVRTIPFKNIFSKDIFVGNKLKFIALNKDFYEPIIRLLEKNNYNVVALIPFLILENYQLTLSEFSSKEVLAIFKQQKTLFSFSLVSASEIDRSLTSTVHHEPENKTRTHILIVVFVFLWVILLAYIFIFPRLAKPKYSTTPVSTYVAKPTIIESESSPSAAPTIEYIAAENLRIKIVNASGVSGLANQIKQLLNKNNFKNVSVETSSGSGAKNILSHSSKVSPETITQLKSLLESKYGSFSDLESNGLIDFDIVITKITP